MRNLTHRRCFLSVLLLGLAAGCGAEPPLQPAPDAPTRAAPKTPRSVRMACIQAAQAQGGAEYALSQQGEAMSGRSVAQAMELRFDARGVRLTGMSASAPPSWQVSTRLLRFRCGGTTQPLSEATPTASTEAIRNRKVAYERGSLTEWYENGPLGLEQGFTVPTPPADCGPGLRPRELGFEVQIDSALEVHLREDGGGSLELRDERGITRAIYSDLYALDARGRELPARMEYDPPSRSVHLLVDASDAQYPVRVDPLWSQQAKLVPADTHVFDSFGAAVALSGETAIVGATMLGTGRAYAFERSGSAWTQLSKIEPGDGSRDNFFGSAVAVSGNLVAVGAPLLTSSGKSEAGRVYLYGRTTRSSWLQEESLSPTSLTPDSNFGRAVALDGDTLLVGAPGTTIGGVSFAGSAYVFVRRGGSWSQQAVLAPPDGVGAYEFGWAVALSGNTALVTAPIADTAAGTAAGKSYVFVRSGTSWAWQATLVASDGQANDYLGTAAALQGDTAVLGAYNALVRGAYFAGKAYVFSRSATTWTQEAQLLPSKSEDGAEFGIAVAISGQTVAVGAHGDSPIGVSRAGQVHTFERSGTPASWRETQLARAPDPLKQGRFGTSVALSGSTLIAGAPGGNRDASLGGSAYVFLARPLLSNGAGCTDARECTSGFCTDGVCCDGACGGADADCQACTAAKKGGGLDGVCGLVVKNNPCRASSGACDPSEVCDGTSTLCPADKKAAAGTLCRGIAGACDTAEICNGTDPECPADAKVAAGTSCRASTGPCDPAELCDGANAACPSDGMAAAGTVCRAATGPCDLAELCSGTSGACPSDARAPRGTVCRSASGPCDQAEGCSGTSKSCPADSLLAAGTSCRAAAGPCDQAEVCSGTSKSCPADQLKGNTEVCRSAAGTCDAAEFCSGAAAACPADKYKPMIAVCRSATGLCDVAEYCSGDGPICPPDDFQPAGTLCRDAVSDCDAAEVCSGTRASCSADTSKPDGTSCSGGTCKAGMCI